MPDVARSTISLVPAVLGRLRPSCRHPATVPYRGAPVGRTTLPQCRPALAGVPESRGRATGLSQTAVRLWPMTQQSGAHRAEVIDSEQVDEQLIEAERRVPDVAQYAGGVSSDSQHAALRASVRQLGQLLGEALTRHEGPELLAQVERDPSALPRAPRRRAARRARRVSTTPRRSVLARAFTAYFQLVNITEQLHRWREVAAAEEGPLAATARRIGERPGEGHLDRRAASARCSTGWSTARSSPPTHRGEPPLGAGAAAQDRRRRGGPGGPAPLAGARPRSIERRLAELVDLLWQTDELRVVRPEPKDEARTAIYYLQSIAAPGRAGPAGGAGPGPRPPSASSCRPTARPLRFGSWAGGDRDGNPNVTPPVTLDVLALQHDFGLRTLIAARGGPAHRDERLDPGRPGHRGAAGQPGARRRGACRSPTPPSARLNAEEPYRLKLSYVRVRLQRTRDRLADGTPHEPGPGLPRARRAARRPEPDPRLDAAPAATG